MKETEIFSFRSLYELELMSVKPARGFYTISLSIVPQKADKRFIGTTGAEVRMLNFCPSKGMQEDERSANMYLEVTVFVSGTSDLLPLCAFKTFVTFLELEYLSIWKAFNIISLISF